MQKKQQNEEISIIPRNTSVVPQFEITPEQNKTLIQQVQMFIKEQMIKGEDYGIIPGIEKPSLLKPGAEKLCNIFGFSIEIAEVDKLEDWDRGLFNYTYKAIVRNKRTGLVEAECIGSCNSKEAKYAFRWIPEFKATKDMIANANKQEERQAKSGKTFVWYRIPNEDIYTQVNTLQKMAQKRAMVGAVLIATRASGYLTQDVEDMGNLEEPSGEVPIKEENTAQESKPVPQDIYLSDKQFKFLDRLIKEQNRNPKELAQQFGGVEFITQLTKGDASKLIDFLMNNKVQPNENLNPDEQPF